MNFSTTADDFTTLKNGIDSRLEIIQHIETGFYNITKTAKLVNKLKSAENGPAGYPAGLSKPAKNWFSNTCTKDLIQECLDQTGLEFVHFKIDAGTRNEFKGTYVHELLYDHFLAWLDPKYAIKISMILKDIHSKANIRITQERDSIMAELRDFREETRIQREEDERRYEELQRRNQADELIKQQILRALAVANANNDITQAKLDKADAKADSHRNISLDILSFTEKLVKKTNALNNALIDKSKLSTINPRMKNLHHGFALSEKIFEDGMSHITCIGGQEKHVIRQCSKHETERKRKILKRFTPIANPIDFRNNICSAGHEMISKAISKENTRRMEAHANKKLEYAEKIAKYKQEKENVKASDEARYLEDVNRWNNSESLRKLENEAIRREISMDNDNLKETIRSNNLHLPRGSPLKRTFNTDPQRRMYTAERILTIESYRSKYGLSEVRPDRDDYLSGEKIESIQRSISRLMFRMNMYPKLIDERDIPVSFRPSVYTWKENRYITYESFRQIFDDILDMTQSTPIDYDPKEFDIDSSINFDGLDDISEDDFVKEAAELEVYEDTESVTSED